MGLLATYDPYVILSLSMSFLLMVCVIIFILMRDPYAVPPHHVRRTVWCTGRHRSARVDFVEWVETGMVRRSIQGCPLRGAHGSCDGACSHQLV